MVDVKGQLDEYLLAPAWKNNSDLFVTLAIGKNSMLMSKHLSRIYEYLTSST